MSTQDLMTPITEAMEILCKALKLPEHTISFDLKAEAKRLPEVSVTYHPKNSDAVTELMSEFQTKTEDFVLVPKDHLDAINSSHGTLVTKLAAEIAVLRASGRSIILNETDRTKQLLELQEKLRWRCVALEPAPLATYVEVLRPSGYTTTPYEILTAQFDPNYKGWTDPANDRITDSGEGPKCWRPLSDMSNLP
jgi:hypothetical protein